MLKKIFISILFIMPLNAEITPIQDDNELFNVLNNTEPTIIYWCAEWCGPCKQIMTPAIEQAAEIYGDKVIFRSIDNDQFRHKKRRFNVQELPVIIFRKNNKENIISGTLDNFNNYVEDFLNDRMVLKKAKHK